MIRLQELDDLIPDFGRLKHDGAVVAFGEFPEAFGAAVGVVKAAAKFFGNDTVVAAREHGDGAMIRAQMFFRGIAVAQKQANGKDGHVKLSDVDETVVGCEQNDTRDFSRVFPREISRDAGSERFANEVRRVIRGKQLQRFIGCGVDRLLGRRAGTVFVAGIFEEVNVECTRLLNGIGELAALECATGVAMSDEHLALRRLRGRHSFPTDRFARGAGPAGEIL